MEKQTFIQNDGRMPVLGALPTLLQKPITQLKKLPCVAGVISGHQQDDSATMLHIEFSEKEVMDYMQALQCFNVTGIKTEAMQVWPLQRFMKIKLSHSKNLLN